MKWKCLRCGQTFSDRNRRLWCQGKREKPCRCVVNPCPWEEIPTLWDKIKNIFK